MGKEILFSNINELEQCRKTIHANLEKSLQNLKAVFKSNDPVDVFDACKYNKIVLDPLSGENQNVMEMINQYQTYLVTINGLNYLFEKYPDKSFVARFGNISGYDIESTDGELVAECFAAVSYRNNKKLEKDLERLSLLTNDIVCYEFFYDKVFTQQNHETYKTKYPKINIVKFKTLK